MKKQLRILYWSTLLLVATWLQAAGAPSVADFRIEVLVHQPDSAAKSIPVRCNGCAWNTQSIDCPADGKYCRVIVDARDGIQPAAPETPHSDEIRPVSGTVCLGFGTGAPRNADTSSGTPAGLDVTEVVAGSPAELAGFKAGDLLTDLNSKPMRHGMEIRVAVQKLAAGDGFDATVYRENGPVFLRGRLGVMTTADKCMPADPALLAKPAVEGPTASKALFTLTFEDIGDADLRCLSGCPWRMSTPCQRNFRCSFRIDQDGNADGSGVEESGAEEKDDAANSWREPAEQSGARVNMGGVATALLGDIDCASDLAAHGQPMDRPMDTDPTLIARLTKQVSPQNIQGQPCWYKTADGEVYAHVHSSCGTPVNFHFLDIHPSGWSLSGVEVRGSCPPGR